MEGEGGGGGLWHCRDKRDLSQLTLSDTTRPRKPLRSQKHTLATNQACHVAVSPSLQSQHTIAKIFFAALRYRGHCARGFNDQTKGQRWPYTASARPQGLVQCLSRIADGVDRVEQDACGDVLRTGEESRAKLDRGRSCERGTGAIRGPSPSMPASCVRGPAL